MSSEDAEVAALDRVLTRTVLTKDEDLQQLLVKLLPALVQKLATTQAKTRAKTLELLNHINKRVKALPATALPLLPLVQLAVQVDGSPMVRSFGLVYVEMGIGRAPPSEQLAAVPLLLSGISKRAPQHQAVALRVVTQALSALQPAPGGSYSQVTVPGCSAPVNAISLLPADPADRQLFLRHALKLLLYQRPSSGGRAQIQTPLGLANAAGATTATAPAAAAAAAAAAADALRAQPGLSAADVAALEEKGVPEQEMLIKQKLGLLSLLAAAAAGMPGNAAAAAVAMAGSNGAPAAATTAAAAAEATEEGMYVDHTPPAAAAAAGPAPVADSSNSSSRSEVFLTSEELLLPLLAASCDPYEAVARRGGDLLVKLINPDAAKPAVDLEQRDLVESLMRLLLGDQDPRAAQPAPQPAGPALAVRVMQLLVRSVTAASIFPGAPLVMHACLTGPSSSPRLVRLGAEWTGWVFKHAPPHQLKAMAGPVTHRLLSALGLSDEDDSAAATAAAADGAAAAAAAAAAVGGSGGGSNSGALAALASSAEARGHVFSALAQLANRMPDLFKDNTHLASRLFGALSVEAPGSRTALQEALGAMAGALAAGIQKGKQADPAKLQEIEELLMSSINNEQAAVRLCAAQWAARLFPRSHMPSRYVLLLAAGDTKPEVRDVGLTGLGLHPSQVAPDLSPLAYKAAVQGLGLPPPADVISHLVERHKQLGLNGDLSRPLPLPDASCQALVAFLKASATAAATPASAAEPSQQQQQQQQLAGYDSTAHAILLENLACRGAGRETVAAALEGLVVLVGGTAEWMHDKADAATALQTRYSMRQQWLQHWLTHNHLPVRSAAAQLLALSATCLDTTAAEALLQTLLGNFPAVGGSSSSSSKLLEEQEGSVLAAGFLLARAQSVGQPLLSQQQQQSAVTALHQQLLLHGNSSNSNNDAPVGSSSSSSGRSVVLAGAAALALGYCGLVGVPLPGLEPTAAAAAADGGSSSSSSDELPLLRVLFTLAGSKDSRAVLRAVTAVGYIGAGSGNERLKLAAAKGLLRVVCVKGVSEEVLLAAGEALAAIAGDIEALDPQMLLWSTYDSIADCVDAAQPSTTATAAAAGAVAAPMQVDSEVPTSNPTASTLADQKIVELAGNTAVQEYLLNELCRVLCVSPKEEVRCAGVVVLVSLLQLCSGSPLIKQQLPQLQSTFTGLLGDSNDLTQDLAARGVSLVYSRGGSGLQQQLLGQLLGLLQGQAGPAGGPGSSAAGAAGVKLTGDTKLFEEGQLGNAPGGAGLTTYRELCSLANEMGQPDLIYRFMDLARASSNLSAKRGAAVGVARIARLAASAAGQEEGGGGLASLLGPERLAALLPKLYRLTHDPSPKVAESMSAIWAALLDDPRAELDNHFDPIAKSLLNDMGARLWRVRQAGCTGLTDLLAGRRWGQLAPHMEQMWTMALRAFDDVKESVRSAAAGLLRSLRGLSLRLMDRQQTPAADVAACCQVVLPLLAGSQGLGSGVEEVRAIATDVLCSGIKTAGPAQVLPVLPVVVPVLLEALSGLEDARLNYVEQHAERVGIDAEKLAAARLAAARASSLTEALDACSRSLTGPAAAEMAPGLASLVRRGVGLNTKAGTARFIKGLATRLGQDLKPAAPTLLKPLVSAVSSESSGQVKKAYAGAAAALAVRCVGEKRQEKFVTDALAAYGAVSVDLQPVDTSAAQQQQQQQSAPMTGVESSSGGDDSSRQAGGLLLRELLRESGDTFSKYASQILPTAFIATHDEAPSVAAAWAPVWSDGCPSEPAALRMHTPELAGLISGGLQSSSWGRKRSAAKALVVLADVAPDQLSPYSPHLAQQLLQEGAQGRLWDGKEGLLTALGALGASCTRTLCVVPGLTVILQGLLSAAARKKTVYRTAALAALQKFLDALPPLTAAAAAAAAVDGGSVWEVVSPPMLQALQQQAENARKPPAAGAAATEGAEEEVKPLPLVEACNCLASAFKIVPPTQQATAVPQLVRSLTSLLTAPGFSWSTWLAVVQLTAALAAAAGGGGGGSGGYVVGLVPLAGGLVHVLQHSTISQLRLKCLETLLQLLQLVQADPAAAAAFKAATAPQQQQQQQQGADSNGIGGEQLPAFVAACLEGVSANDPSVAHKALAAQAAAVL